MNVRRICYVSLCVRVYVGSVEETVNLAFTRIKCPQTNTTTNKGHYVAILIQSIKSLR